MKRTPPRVSIALLAATLLLAGCRKAEQPEDPLVDPEANSPREVLRRLDAEVIEEGGKVTLIDLSVLGEAPPVRDEQLAILTEFPDLQTLYLTNAAITDDGLRHIAGLKGLTSLNLSGTQVTDKGLEHLNGLINLRVLRLLNTGITPQAYQAWRTAMHQRQRDAGKSDEELVLVTHQ